MAITSWDIKFLALVKEIESWSKDRSTKVGTVIVDKDNNIRSTGYNGFPRNINDDIDSRHERPAKYKYTEHAERNAIYNAARIGVSLNLCTIYLGWFPCHECARAIIQSGIIKVVCKRPSENPTWDDSFNVARELFEEAGIEVEYYD